MVLQYVHNYYGNLYSLQCIVYIMHLLYLYCYVLVVQYKCQSCSIDILSLYAVQNHPVTN